MTAKGEGDFWKVYHERREFDHFPRLINFRIRRNTMGFTLAHWLQSLWNIDIFVNGIPLLKAQVAIQVIVAVVTWLVVKV